ncbi:FtsH-binding integral membrane protein [Arthrobacter sp. UYCu512]
MSVSAPQATRSANWKDGLLATAFVLASVSIPLLLWPSDGTGRDMLLRVFLLGWAACGLLLASTLIVPTHRISSQVVQGTLWLGLGLVLGLSLGTIPWNGLASGPVWQIWLAIVMSAGYLQQLQRRRA